MYFMSSVVINTVNSTVEGVFFHETATTGIYPYLHTLSLHDALPISPRRRWDQHHRLGKRPGGGTDPVVLRPGHAARRPNRGHHPPRNLGRSEAHTSELQSLMRTSFAVFFLKKKTYTEHPMLFTHHRPQQRTTIHLHNSFV